MPPGEQLVGGFSTSKKRSNDLVDLPSDEDRLSIIFFVSHCLRRRCLKMWW